MIRYHIPAEYADAVRAALTCDCNFGVRNTGRGEPGPYPCPDCPPSFWWGITAERRIVDGPGLSERHSFHLPAVVQQMLDPCPTCGGTGCRHTQLQLPKYCGSGCCPDCIEGRLLIELVTDCPNPVCHRGHEMVADGRNEPIDSGQCREHCDDGTVSLGVVTANQLVLDLDQAPRHGYVLGPSDATHAIHLTGVER